MAYQVLARKWRPQSFSELIGQEHVATTLLNALKSSRMPHALLFTGARGVGKTSAARILAKSLRCAQGKDFVPCNQCDDCREIASGTAVDVIEIDGASNNGVENIRELRETVGYMPSRGQYKIYIIDEVHMLSTSAFNALLKTLEEPPQHVIFIFATTEPHKIPVTILSRCQRFDFRRISVRKIVERLKAIADAEGVEAENQALWLIGREAEGSMRDSQSLLDQVITFCGKKITHAQVVDILGLTDRTLLSQTLDSLITRNASTLLGIIEKVFHHGYDPKQFAQDLLEQLRNLMIVKISGKGSLDFLDLPEQETDELKKFAGSLSEEDVHLLFDMTLKGVNDVVRAQDPRIVLEMLMLRLSQAPRLTSIDNLLKGIGSHPVAQTAPTQTRAAQTTEEPAPQMPTQGSPSAPAPTQVLKPADRWATLVQHIKNEKPLLGAKLEYAALQNIDSEKMTISFKKENEFFFNQISQKEITDLLSDYTRRFWGAKLKVEVKLMVGVSSMPSLKEIRDSAQEQAEKEMRAKVDGHPLVREVKNILNAKITSIKESP